MSHSLTCLCPDCKQYASMDPTVERKLLCPKCQKTLAELGEGAEIFDRCPACAARQFYLMKDFNQFLGCAVMLIGIALVPLTYGISLPVFALIDWLIYRRYPHLIVCYKCAAEFRGFKEKEKTLKPFMHHIGLKYDKYR